MYVGHDNTTRDLTIHGLCLRLAQQHGLKPRVIVDLGAHKGEALQGLSPLLEDCERMILVEPSTVGIEAIFEALDRLDFDRAVKIWLVPGILGPKKGEAKLFEIPGNTESTNLFSDREGKFGPAEESTVEVFSWNDELGSAAGEGARIDLLKCNIEGGEYDLMDQGFFDLVDAFVVECHNRHVKREDGAFRQWTDLLAGLRDDFDLTSHGDLTHKYCFLTGVRA